jgi:hypothetical protein
LILLLINKHCYFINNKKTDYFYKIILHNILIFIALQNRLIIPSDKTSAEKAKSKAYLTHYEVNLTLKEVGDSSEIFITFDVVVYL